ncbi:unnamed protein product, partial [Mesorhabditis belari]|uniref:Uncharacterized protein n=1 Tax=Mesorhabditis belari TaxID=2138241 RepID=A0AAF3FH30_9BILA
MLLRSLFPIKIDKSNHPGTINSSTSNVKVHLDIGWIHPRKHEFYDYKKNRQWSDFIGLEDFGPLDPSTDYIKEVTLQRPCKSRDQE